MRVNGNRRYSLDLPQGGLEVPCILTFSTPQAYESEKTKKLVESSLALPVKLTTNTDGDDCSFSRDTVFHQYQLRYLLSHIY